MRFIEANRQTPWFCYIAANAPHTPLNVAKRYSEPYPGKNSAERAQFYGMIANLDEETSAAQTETGRTATRRRYHPRVHDGQWRRMGVTLDPMQFVVDGYNFGMRGRKTSECDGGRRVPFFLRWPRGTITGGKDVDELTASVDFMPTLLDLCGAPTRQGVAFHGKSIRPTLLEGNPEWEERVLVTDSQRNAYPVKWRKSAA